MKAFIRCLYKLEGKFMPQKFACIFRQLSSRSYYGFKSLLQLLVSSAARLLARWLCFAESSQQQEGGGTL